MIRWSESVTFSAPHGLRVVLVVQDGKVIDGLIDQRDIEPQVPTSSSPSRLDQEGISE